MKTTVSTKGRVILPAELRRQDGIEPGQEFEVDESTAASIGSSERSGSAIEGW
jgi:AbrB family looped-hinge helix DNA binding protein